MSTHNICFLRDIRKYIQFEPLWDHENLFEKAVVRATEGYCSCHTRRHNGDNCGISFPCSIL